MEIFLELTAIVCLAALVSFFMKFLKQPLIVGYILTGFLVGPQFLNVLHSTTYIDALSKIGITILLFIVGLNLSPKVIKDVGKVALLTGVGQVVFTTLIGFFIVLAFGINPLASLFIAVALTFSSTIIILKLLSDKGDLNKLYGKISVGFLIVQDIIAAVILIVMSTLGSANQTNPSMVLVVVLLKGIDVIGILYLISVYILPRLTQFVATSQELLFLFSISWGLTLASIFYLLGFSAEIGALIAGVMLSVTPYAPEIGSRLKPLRDFFVVLFFILIGSHIDLSTISQIIFPAVILSVFVLIGNPLIMIVLMNLLGYKRKTAFLVGITVAQISEFSLILAAVAYESHQLSKNELSLITLVGIITIAGSTYLILYAHLIYPHIEKILKYLEFRKTKKAGPLSEIPHDVILFGFDRVGNDFIKSFEKLQKNYLVVDFNPQLIKVMQSANIPFKYGDAEDAEFLHELNLKETKMFVSTIPDVKTSLLLLKKIRQENPSAIVILLTHDINTAEELYENGATYVIMPHYLGARYASNLIHRLGFDRKEFEEEKAKHLAYIEKRKS